MKAFNENQLAALSRNSTQGFKWNNSTLQKRLRLKFSCGNRGYNDLLEGLPYPALRTLRRSIQDIQFESGILEEILYLMKTKVERMKETERIMLSDIR